MSLLHPMIDSTLSWPAAVLAIAAYTAITAEPKWPEAHPRVESSFQSALSLRAPEATTTRAASGDGARVEHQSICVGSRHWSAGTLGDTVLYRANRIGNRLEVGYFVYWSTERPWGNNILSYTLVPALATDAVYSHFMFVLPGAKDFLYGPADVEGAKVEYDIRPDGTLDVVGGIADDGTHDPVRLTRSDLVDARGQVVLLTDVWSHQLGAHGGGRFSNEEAPSLHCYGLPSIHPMTNDVARAFRLGDEQKPLRANPAWSIGKPVTADTVASK